MLKKKNFNERLPLILAFVLPILIMIGVFIGKEIWPFGGNCFLRTDLYHQYIAFFEDMGDRLRQGKGLLYAFDIGLGSNYTALFAYYLSSPIHLLAFLIPTEYMIEFITYLIVLKIGLCGWAMAWYLSKRFHTNHYAITICGVCYALSGYLAAYSWNIMWLDVLWLSILAIYGLEKLLDENKPFLYCVFLALSILCNYYIAIMLCIFLVLYFINRLIAMPHMSGRQLALKFGQFALFSLLGGAMAAVLLIPAAYALSGTASANTTFPKMITNYFSVIDMLARHLVVVNVEIGLDHWPNLYSGVLVFLAVPLYYMNKNVSFREKIANTLLIGFMLLSFNTNVLNYIWHGFHYPNSLPCRQSYLYTFVLMVMCFEGFRQLETVSKEKLVRVMWGAIAAILVVEVITDSDEIPYYACYASIAFIALYTLVYYMHKRKALERKSAIALVLCLLIIEMGLNTAVTSVSFVKRLDFMQYNDAYDDLVAVTEEGKVFTRIERNVIRTKNDGAYFGYNSASIFSSTTNKLISDFYRDMGLEGNTNAYAITGATPFMWSFLSVEYKLSEVRLPASPLYELVTTATDRKGNTSYLYHNLYTLPLGYLVPADMNELWTVSSSSPIRNQNSFANLAAGTGNIFEAVSSNVSGTTLTATVKEDGHYVVHVSSSAVKKVTASVNDGSSKVWDNVNRGYLIDYGFLNAGDNVKLVAADNVTMAGTLYLLKADKFIETVETLSAHPFVITEFTDSTFKTQIRGTVDADADSLLTFSIPYETGWSVQVDGTDTEVTPLAGSFVAVPVSAGHHEVTLRYVPTGLNLGIMVSLAGLGIFLLCLAVWLLLRAKRNKETEEEFTDLIRYDEEDDGIELLPDPDQASEKQSGGPSETSRETMAAKTSAQSAAAGTSRIAALHQFDEAERLRDKDRGRLPVLAFENGAAYPRLISPAERQQDEAVLKLDSLPPKEVSDPAPSSSEKVPVTVAESLNSEEAGTPAEMPEERPAEVPAKALDEAFSESPAEVPSEDAAAEETAHSDEAPAEDPAESEAKDPAEFSAEEPEPDDPSEEAPKAAVSENAGPVVLPLDTQPVIDSAEPISEEPSSLPSPAAPAGASSSLSAEENKKENSLDQLIQRAIGRFRKS